MAASHPNDLGVPCHHHNESCTAAVDVTRLPLQKKLHCNSQVKYWSHCLVAWAGNYQQKLCQLHALFASRAPGCIRRCCCRSASPQLHSKAPWCSATTFTSSGNTCLVLPSAGQRTNRSAACDAVRATRSPISSANSIAARSSAGNENIAGQCCSRRPTATESRPRACWQWVAARAQGHQGAAVNGQQLRSNMHKTRTVLLHHLQVLDDALDMLQQLVLPRHWKLEHIVLKTTGVQDAILRAQLFQLLSRWASRPVVPLMEVGVAMAMPLCMVPAVHGRLVWPVAVNVFMCGVGISAIAGCSGRGAGSSGGGGRRGSRLQPKPCGSLHPTGCHGSVAQEPPPCGCCCECLAQHRHLCSRRWQASLPAAREWDT